MSSFSYKDRERHIKSLKEEPFDLLIIGGGITGAGALREAQMRGLKAALVEKSLFASGTSSRSSKLAHGGIRYLENMEFSLVAEALKERQNLLRMAPHMVHPLPFLVPMYKGDRVGWWKMKAGMLLYDLLSAFKTPGLHKTLGVQKIKEKYSELKREKLLGGFLYYDAYMDDDRLVLETLRAAVAEGAVVASSMEAELSVESSKEGAYKKIQLKNQKTGESFVAQAQHVLCSVGPWTDQVAQNLLTDWQERMRPSKGVHITLPKELLKLDTAIVMAADKEKRILFCIPRKDYDIVGTTDTDYTDAMEEVRTSKEDVEYILKVLKDYFPQIEVKESDILGSYAGVRPLINDGSKSESKVSRSHWIKTYKDQQVTVISGGKYTTYLAMAEDAVNSAIRSNKSFQSKVKHKDTRVSLVPLNTEENNQDALELFCERAEQVISLSRPEAEEFCFRHGAQALSFLEKYSRAQSLLELEVLVAIYEYCTGSLEEFYFYRVSYMLSGKNLDSESIEKVLQIFKRELALTDSQTSLQKEQFSKSWQFEKEWRKS